MKEKIAIVCQRYGLEVNGGSELYCRQMSEHLKEHFDVEVYTTCAVDYLTWKDEYSPGTEKINGVTIHRFRVEHERDLNAFGLVTGRVLNQPKHSDADEEKWIDEQGPYCPELLETLYAKQDEYKTILFMTYLYYLSARGLCMGFRNAYLVPTAHDEPPIYLRYYEKVYDGAKGYIWNMPEEKAFVEKRFPHCKGKPGVMAGIGIEAPLGELPPIPEALANTPYLVYAGRIDEAKGCREMFDFFLRYKREHGGPLKLALMGKAVMEVPEDEDIVNLGFVSDEMKFSVMRDARALVICSRFESLSMVVLESMTMGRPVLVTGHCEVLKGHCLRSNAGLWFDNYEEFAATLDYLLTHEAEYEAMRENGKRYVEENYRWDVIIGRVRGLIDNGI